MVIVVPGTGWPKWSAMYAEGSVPMRFVEEAFGSKPVLFRWSGANRASERTAAAAALASFINAHPFRPGEPLDLVGFSHGGNIAILATHNTHQEVDHLVTIATPVLKTCRPARVRRHIHVFNPNDPIQRWGGDRFLGFGPAARTFPGATNLPVRTHTRRLAGRHGDLMWSEAAWIRIRELASNER